MPHLITAQIDFEHCVAQPLKLPFHMQWPKVMHKELEALASALNVSKRHMRLAEAAARRAQAEFHEAMARRGSVILRDLQPGQTAAVIIGRAYNTCDAWVCQDVPAKLRRLGVLPIPMDFLPIHCADVLQEPVEMFWHSGQAILSAAKIIRSDSRLHAIYVTNFNCGPDSFLLSFFRRALDGEPVLELEFDDHTADAGVVTRCEAFFDSLRTSPGARRA